MSILIYTKKAQIRDMIEEEMDTMSRETIAQTALDVYHMCEAVNELIQQKVGYDLNVARKVMNEKGRVDLSEERVAWKAVNQFTKKETSVDLSKMMIGGVWLGQNADFLQQTPVVDTVKDPRPSTGCTL